MTTCWSGHATGWSRPRTRSGRSHTRSSTSSIPTGTEADVECASLDTLAGVASDLGATREEADALARIYREEVYPELPDEYTEGGCAE